MEPHMLPFESRTAIAWARLPEAEPPARLRAAVLEDWRRMHGQPSSHIAGVIAGFAVAALFVLAVALPLRVRQPWTVDPALALLRAQGLEVAVPPTSATPSEVRRVARGSTAERLGLRPGDQLLSVDLPMNANGMLNVAVLRGESPQYFALPAIARRAGEPDAGMASTRTRADAAPPRVAAATHVAGDSSFLQSLI